MIRQCRGCGREIRDSDYSICSECKTMQDREDRRCEVWELEWRETDRFFEEYERLKGMYGDIMKFGR